MASATSTPAGLARSAGRRAWAAGRRAAHRPWPEPGGAIGAVGLASVAGAWAVALRPSIDNDTGVLAGLAVVLVAIGVLSRKLPVVSGGVVLLGVVYLVGRYGRPVSVLPAAAFATLLLAIMELASWSGRLALRTRWRPGIRRRQWSALAVLCVGGGGAAAVAAEVGVAGAGTGTMVVTIGAGAALVVGFLFAQWVRAVSEH